MKQGNQRRKGRAFEQRVVRLAKQEGLVASRMAPMQATVGGSDRYSDVMIEAWFVECKHHKRVPVNRVASPWTDVANHIVVWQDNGRRPKVAMDLQDFLGLLARVKRLFDSVPKAAVNESELEVKSVEEA